MHLRIIKKTGLITEGYLHALHAQAFAVHEEEGNCRHHGSYDPRDLIKVSAGNHDLPHVISVIGDDDSAVDTRQFGKSADEIRIVILQADFNIDLRRTADGGFALDDALHRIL